MSPSPQPHDVRFFATPEELRDWFDANHETADELWLGYYRKSTGHPSVDWPQAVDEALCVGWIDGVRYRLDDTSHAQRFTPRHAPGISTLVAARVRSSLTLCRAMPAACGSDRCRRHHGEVYHRR